MSFSGLIRRAWPEKARANVARAAGCSRSAAGRWISGEVCPRATVLFQMADADPHFRAVFLEWLDEVRRGHAARREAERVRRVA